VGSFVNILTAKAEGMQSRPLGARSSVTRIPEGPLGTIPGLSSGCVKGSFLLYYVQASIQSFITY
jgi:hypothetical protein